MTANNGGQRFEDLIAWQQARELTRIVYDVTRAGPFARDWSLVTQMRRAAVSTMANIAEGFERKGQGEFHHFLTIAKASCAELGSHLYVALDVGFLPESDFLTLQTRVRELGRVLGGLRAAVARRRPASCGSRLSSLASRIPS